MKNKLINNILQYGVNALSSFIEEKEEVINEPEPGVFYSDYRDDFDTDANLRSLTPAKLGALIRSADEGDTRSQYEVFEIVEQDPVVTATMNKRRRAMTSKDMLITAMDETDQRAIQASDLCNELILGNEGYDGISNWNEGLRDLTDAVGKGFALSQIVWRKDENRFIPTALERWPQRDCQIGDPNNIWSQDGDVVRILTDKEMYRGELLQPYQWITHVHKTWSVSLNRAALFRSITWYYLFKRFAWKDWVIFGEKYGSPMRKGTYHAGATDADKAALRKAVFDLGRDSACILSDQTTIDLIESSGATGRSTLPYPELIKHCNSEIAKLIMGNPLTTDPGETGARSLGEVYERSEVEMTKDDCKWLAQTIRRDLCAPIVGFNLGWDYPIPRVKFAFEENKNLNDQAKRDSMLVKDVKLPISKSYFYEEYNIPEPGEDAELVNAPSEEAEDKEETKEKSVANMLASMLADTKKKNQIQQWMISMNSQKENKKK